MIQPSALRQRKQSTVAVHYDLAASVDRALGIFGDNVRHEICSEVSQRMSESGKIGGILEDPDLFVSVVEETLGIGMWAIERQIIREIKSNFNVEFSKSESLASILRKMRKRSKLASIQELDEQNNVQAIKKPAQMLSPLEHLKAFGFLARAESRVTIFVWSLTTAYLLASGLKPAPQQLFQVILAGYFISLGIYVFNDLMDLQEDRINHSSRPIASGQVATKDAWMVFWVSIGIAFVTSLLVGVLCFIVVLASFLLGVSYSHPSVRAKRRFPHKLLVSVLGATCCSLCGGIVAGNLSGPVYFSAAFFGLFAMVTLLLGDLADVPGDMAAGVKSLPIVLGQKNAVVLVACIPLVIAFLGVALFRLMDFNPLFPVIILGITTYSSLSIITLLRKYDNYLELRKVKSHMRVIHFALQLSLLIGMIAI